MPLPVLLRLLTPNTRQRPGMAASTAQSPGQGTCAARLSAPRQYSCPSACRIKVHFKDSKGALIRTVEANEGDDILSIAHEYDIDLEGPCSVPHLPVSRPHSPLSLSRTADAYL